MQFRDKGGGNSLLKQEMLDRQMVVSEDGNTIHINCSTQVAVFSDIHIGYKTKRPFYMYEILSYFDKFITRLKGLNNPTAIFLGDLFDKDLNVRKGLMYFEEFHKKFLEIQKITSGRCFMVYGNHEDTYLDITPSALIMSPSKHLKEIMIENGREVDRSFGSILLTPETIYIGNTKLSLFHFRKNAKNYQTITGDREYHIAFYHDTYVNSQMRNKMESKMPVDKIWGNELKDLDLKNFDAAIFGDFHIPLAPFRVNNRRNTLISIPGSYGRNNISTETHNRVYLPIITIGRKEVEISITEFELIPFQASYNLEKSSKDISKITSDIRTIVDKMRQYHKKEINIENYHKYVGEVYGVEWSNKIFTYLNKIKEFKGEEGENELSET